MIQTEILSQLAEIQRTLGSVVGTVEALKEEVKSQGIETSTYREQITSGVNNALNRIAALENDLKEVKHTIEKTLKPLATGAVNLRQRIIGFLAAWSLVAGGVGILIVFFVNSWDNIFKFFALFGRHT